MPARCAAHGSDAGAVADYVATGGREVYEHCKGVAYHSGGRAFAEREHAWPLLEPQAAQGELSQRLPLCVPATWALPRATSRSILPLAGFAAPHWATHLPSLASAARCRLVCTCTQPGTSDDDSLRAMSACARCLPATTASPPTAKPGVPSVRPLFGWSSAAGETPLPPASRPSSAPRAVSPAGPAPPLTSIPLARPPVLNSSTSRCN
ncbi:hypothetical protein CERSUDRAFT_101306 [Gelatoporia subvermispora B]|uniref:Uncharacterized protein n=1 Tax=Ceriporiopsis subvermispora (strain B) TaxID=914234 RepID=M2P5K3_CERS8|nr:hypothetical protein CERSUDRAFT_101306 [Gelatoporia subvermispora B]